MSRTYGQYIDKRKIGSRSPSDWFNIIIIKIDKNSHHRLFYGLRHVCRGHRRCGCHKQEKRQIRKIRRQQYEREIEDELKCY